MDLSNSLVKSPLGSYLNLSFLFLPLTPPPPPYPARVSHGITQLRESFAATQWFLENAFHDNDLEEEFVDEEMEAQLQLQLEKDDQELDQDQEQEPPVNRKRLSGSSDSDASALQALRQLQLEMIQVSRSGFAL